MNYCPDCGSPNIHYIDTRDLEVTYPVFDYDTKVDLWECSDCKSTFFLFYEQRPDDPPYEPLLDEPEA